MKKNLLWLVLMVVIGSVTIIGCGGGSSSGTIATDDTNTIVDDGTVDDGTVDVSTIKPTFTFSLPSPYAIYVGSDFTTDGTVTAWDNLDGDVTAKVVIVSNVDPNTVGEYTVVYSVTDSDGNTEEVTRIVFVVAIPAEIPVDSSTEITGTALACNTVDVSSSTDANEYNASVPFKTAISSPMLDIPSRELLTSHNTIARLGMVMNETNATGGEVSTTKYHPIVVSYLEQIDAPYLNSSYLMGDGSADIGDPDNVDKVMVSITTDNGKTWKDQFVSYSTELKKSSIEVVWGDNNETIEYPGDAQKPDMVIHKQDILVAWNDKYCPTGNPFGLDAVDENNNIVDDPSTYDGNITFPNDVFAVNGPQGFIDYREEDNVTGEMSALVAPNGKKVYQVPFSCVWTARGTIDENNASITWHAPKQLTSGTRDSNHIWLAASDAGFAIAWQEDVMGLKSGKGAGPGEGWSGATTNRGSEIWYTAIKKDDFAATDGAVDTKPVSTIPFKYPVRITDNEQCQAGEKKIYCNYFCDTYGSLPFEKGNQSGEIVNRCLTYDTDMLSDTISILDGDTGASRSALKILATNVPGEHVVVLGYEETKALKERDVAIGDQDQGTIPTDIGVEGKSVYFESFDFNAFFDFDESNISTIQTTAMPIVSAGNIINVKSPRSAEDPYSDGSGEMVYENARRLVIGTQIDSCDAQTPGDRTFAILYKQSFETQGSSSDMFVRTWEGFKYSDIAPVNELNVTNVSAQTELSVPGDPADYAVSWSAGNLDDNTYENKRENTFSPRIFLRGANIYIGFEYTPYETFTGEVDPILVAKYPNNFHTHIYKGGAWQGPKNITKVLDSSVNTVDARFFTTPKGNAMSGVESDQSNPDVLFLTWGTTLDANASTYIDTNVTGDISPNLLVEINEAVAADERITAEADLFFTRSTDNGDTWEPIQHLAAVARVVIEEKEVLSYASPDGKHLYNAWLQQSVILPQDDVAVTGLDSWFGRVDYNITK